MEVFFENVFSPCDAAALRFLTLDSSFVPGGLKSTLMVNKTTTKSQQQQQLHQEVVAHGVEKHLLVSQFLEHFVGQGKLAMIILMDERILIFLKFAMTLVCFLHSRKSFRLAKHIECVAFIGEIHRIVT